MKKSGILSIVLLLFVLGCEMETVEEKFYGKPEIDERIINFEFSECDKSCSDSGKVNYQTLIDDTLTLELGHWLNCGWDDGSSVFVNKVFINNDTLDIILDRLKSSSMACQCYFNMKLKMHGIEKEPNVIFINSAPLENDSPINAMFREVNK